MKFRQKDKNVALGSRTLLDLCEMLATDDTMVSYVREQLAFYMLFSKGEALWSINRVDSVS